MTLTIQQLNIYPVKSLRGFSVHSAQLLHTGLQYDRFWMVINDRNHFVTQRKHPEMILIDSAIKDGYLQLSKPSAPLLGVLAIALDQVPNGRPINARIWKDNCQVLDEGKAASRWLEQALPNVGHLRLVRMAPFSRRPQSKPDDLGENTQTYFSDAAPLLITNTASLDALNHHLSNHNMSAVTMEHFRPNVVIDGITAFAEHNIKILKHTNYSLQQCYPCQRCSIPTVNIETGTRHPHQEPFALLAEINAMPNNPKAPAFGENTIITGGEGQAITVGDRLTAQYQP